MSLIRRTHRADAIVQTNGSVKVENVPFHAWGIRGSDCDVAPATRTECTYPLRGKLVRYDRPLDPVAEDDWEVNS